MHRAFLVCLAVTIGQAHPCRAQVEELRPPTIVTAGTPASIASVGSGRATLYLVGPDVVKRRQVQMGQEIKLQAGEVRSAGRYLAVVCSEACRSAEFYVVPAGVASLRVLVHPSRAPVGQADAISGVIFPFDEFHNLVLAPVTIDLGLKVSGADVMSRPVTTQHGVAWFRTSSGNRTGVAQVMASVGDVSARRVVQLVASDPCNLRIKAQPTAKGIAVETEPVRDCTGNPVPDGTIVTFTAAGTEGTSTVDAPIKQGVARALMPASSSSRISVASGVVMGNEITLGSHP